MYVYHFLNNALIYRHINTCVFQRSEEDVDSNEFREIQMNLMMMNEHNNEGV